MNPPSSVRSEPAWGALFGAVPFAYVFVHPFQQQALPAEWLVTIGAFVTFLALYVAFILHWTQEMKVRYIALGLLGLAIAFTAYRPSGMTFFIAVAAITPFAIRSDLSRCIMMLAVVLVIMAVEWWLRWPPSIFPWVIGAEAALLGAGMIVASRHQLALARSDRAKERERIARDLHDVLGQSLTMIVMKSELACRLHERDPARALQEITDVEQISRKALTEMREAVTGYQAGDLAAEVERAKGMLHAAGIETTLDYDSVDLSLAHQRVLALVLREGTTNVARHSRAQRCHISLKENLDNYEMRVRDNGRGGPLGDGTGRRSIQERVRAIGGQARWESSDGTELIVSVPMQRRNEVANA